MKEVYIKDFSIYIPDNFVNSRNISEYTGIPEDVVKDKLGITRKPVERVLSTSEMSVIPAKELLESGAIEKEEVGFLICAGSDYKDNYIWTMAPKILHELGIENALGFDISSQCVGSLVAIDFSKSKLASSERSEAIVSVPTKQSELVDYEDRASSFMYDFSDGALAVALSNETGRYRILQSSFVSDGSFSDVVFTKFGERHKNSGNNRVQLTVNDNKLWKERMGTVSEANFMKVITDSLEKSSYTVSDIDYLAFLHTKRSFHSRIMNRLGLSNDQSIFLEDYGHMQGVDPFLSLRLAERKGLIHEGSIISLVSSGTGWTWGATVVEATY